MKLSQFYDLSSIEAMRESPHIAMKDSGLLLHRQLVALNPTVLERRYPDLAFVNAGFEVNNFGGFTEAVQTLRLKQTGGFKSVGGDNKGKVSLEAETTLIPVIERATHATWTKAELEKAKKGNYSLPDRYMKAILTAFNQEVDTSGLIGIEGGKGILNTTDFVTATTSSFASLTPQQKYDAIADQIIAQWNSVNNTEGYRASRVILPTSIYNQLGAKILNAAGGTTPILKALKENFTEIQFFHTAKAESVGGVKVMSILSNSIEVLAFRVPVPLMYSPIDQRGFDFEVNSIYMVAGVDILEPAGGRIVKGL